MINSPIDDIKNRLDIVEVVSSYIRLHKAGRNYKANCPFHAEKTPSFFVSPERQMWHCFGCGAGSSMFDFVMQMEGVEFGDALRILARRAGVELKKIDPKLKTQRTRLYEICELAARFFSKQLEASQTGHQVENYLKKRGLKSQTLKDWRIGYAPDKWRSLGDFIKSRGYTEDELAKAGLVIKSEDNSKNAYDRFRNRIIFPICDLSGQVIGFSGRIYGQGDPKYINSPSTLLYDKSVSLYGLDKARLDVKQKKQAILAEGQLDVVMAHQAGFKNVIAVSGTALTPQHLKIIKRYTENLGFAFDMDVAGESATKKGIELAIQSGLNTAIISLPAGLDPADSILKSKKIFAAALTKAQSVVEFYFTSAFEKFSPSSVDGKKNIAAVLLPVLKRIPNKIEQAHWLTQLSQRIKTAENILRDEMQKIRFNQEYQDATTDQKDICLEAEGGHNLALAQHALGLLLAYPDQIERVRQQPSHLFSHPELEELFKRLKEPENIKKFDLAMFQKKLPAHLTDAVSSLMFRIETINKENFNPMQEVDFSFAQLKKQYIQDQLNKLNLAIREAEAKKDKGVIKDLSAKFNKYTQQLSEI